MVKTRTVRPFQVLCPSELKEGHGYTKVYDGFEERFIMLRHNVTNDVNLGTFPYGEWYLCQWDGPDWYRTEAKSYADSGLIPYHGASWNKNNWVRDDYRKVVCNGIAALFNPQRT